MHIGIKLFEPYFHDVDGETHLALWHHIQFQLIQETHIIDSDRVQGSHEEQEF